VFPADRDAFVAGRSLARRLLAAHTGAAPDRIAFRETSHGKPHLAWPSPGRELSFNVSHTRALVACAVAWERDVGVDVETIREPPLELVDRYFAAPEARAILALPEAERRDAFFAVWTLKEAFIKALGRGLSQPLDRFAVTWTPPALLPYGDFESSADRWHLFRAQPAFDAALAVCAAGAAGKRPNVTVRWASADHVAGWQGGAPIW
jgi:4'-phosphopantetheinyl transferase